ncbi:MAG: nucleotidyltransferase domain-containing protein [Spirochaetaceae bacterium]|jgi:predicted nucleotidyltransferase|nr:nucleotidyltransferase domain-containing protein [Spirochaetaceae bacterium]
MAYGLTESEIAGLRRIFSKHREVEKAVLFGSRARGNHCAYSDIDIALYGAGLDMDAKWALEDEVDGLLLPYKADLSLAGHISSPLIAEHIKNDGVTLYERGGHAD